MLTLCVSAQTVDVSQPSSVLFKHMDLGLNVGSTGWGINVSMPITERINLRAGFDYVPHFNVPMTFDLMSYAGTDDEHSLTQDQKFDKLSSFMESFTGIKIDRKVDMNAHATMVDFKLLVDVFPLRNNKHWYVTAGFYWGSNRVGHIENTITEAPSLMGLIIYNKFYDYFLEDKYYDTPLIDGFPLLDPVYCWEIKEKFQRYGRLGAYVGNFKDVSTALNGKPYLMEPDENGTVQADMYVNHFKPYLGIGYTTDLSKDGRWKVGFDIGALFWGKPKILTHERYILNGDEIVGYGKMPEDATGLTYGQQINIATNVEDINGKVGTYCDIARTLHLYPVLNFKISYKLF